LTSGNDCGLTNRFAQIFETLHCAVQRRDALHIELETLDIRVQIDPYALRMITGASSSGLPTP
jgi:hypothetical protein